MTLAVDHRRSQLAARNQILARLLGLWRIVDPEDLSTVDTFTLAALPFIDSGYVRSSVLAAGFYQRLRPPGITRVEFPDPIPPEPNRAAGLLRGAALSGYVNARQRGMRPERALSNGFVKVAGSASGLVLEGGRKALLSASQLDPASTGRWRRVTGGSSCDFCSMIASRGFVYSEQTGDFESHAHCGCSVEPEFH